MARAHTTEVKPSKAVRRPGDRIFSGLSSGAAFTILAALAGVAIFLTIEGWPAVTASSDELHGDANIIVHVWPLLFGTLLAAGIAMLIAAPLAIGLALVISHYAPRKLAGPIGGLIDLLAAVPSVVYGLWGIQFLAPNMIPIFQWLEENLGFIPLFAGPATTGRTIFTASVVLAVMALPIITSISREVFAQTPLLHQEAALALGATRWEMIRLTVFPYGRSGVVSAVMLGLGRALGETMAIAMVLSATGVISFNLISNQNPSTIAANIALKFPESTGMDVDVLIFSGLTLFVVTFLVNFAGRWIATRGQVKG